jgi:uncharacterized protein (DUF1800 family)
MKYLFPLAFLCLLSGQCYSQTYDDFIGAGHYQGVSITTSDGQSSSQSTTTLNGSGLKISLFDASRFLGQSTPGADFEEIEYLSEIGLEAWLDLQLNLPVQVSFYDTSVHIFNHFIDEYAAMYGDTNVIGNDLIMPNWIYWRMAWWHNIMFAEDLVRQRVTIALSEIFVISENSDLNISSIALSTFYDLLYNHATGNFRDLLFEVSMHPAMGFYLSHLNNPKSDTANNVHPDENYAREIMQLFSIGLYELNPDGTRQLDTAGNFIPSYTNNDIKEFAKVFTGLAPGGYYWPWEDLSVIPVTWGYWYNSFAGTIDYTQPMQMFENWHEPGEKYLLNGTSLMAGQSGLEDINGAIDNLFNHPNVGPFISRLLIQRLVKSNPSAEYIERMSSVFANNGSGTRGDLKALVKAIFLDPEARDCSWLNDPASGKLREPLLRYTQAMKALNASNSSGKMWNIGYTYQHATRQAILSSPSVFNFFLPDYQPNGPVADQDLVAPEFQLLSSATAVYYYNMVYYWFVADQYMEVSSRSSDNNLGSPEYDYLQIDPDDIVLLDINDEMALAGSPQELMDRLDILFTGGTLSDESRTEILSSMNQLQMLDDEHIVKAALFLLMTSPDYLIQK